MVKVTTSKDKEYSMICAWESSDGHCTLQWHDERRLIDTIPEFLDLEWIKIEDPVFDREVVVTDHLNLCYANKKGLMTVMRFE